MEHINKQAGVNLDIFDQNNSNPGSNPFMEGINIAILILLGCGGLYMYCTIMSPKEPSVNFSGITTNAVLTKLERTHSNKKVEKGFQKGQLIVKGHQEAGEKIMITIDGFDKKARYIINFGDGHTQTVTNKSIAHIYREPGTYTLLLKVGYQNDPVQKISKKIYIDQSIEVDTDAYYEK